MSGVYLCSPCTFSAWCLIKHRDVVTLSFHYHIKQWTRTKSCTQATLEAPPILHPPYTFYENVLPFIKWVRGEFNILICDVILKIFWKPLLWCQGTIGPSCHRECSSVAPLSGCDGVVVYCELYILIFLLSLVSLHYFLKVCCEHFPYSVEVSS